MARIAVIGAGMGSLAVAARLATAGHSVTVCERSRTHGGAVGGFTRDGFSFDTGPALLHLPAVYRDLFVKTSRGGRTSGGTRAGRGARAGGRGTLEECVELREVDPASRHLLPDGTDLVLPNASRAAAVKALDAAFGTGAGERWSLLLNRARAVWDATRRPLLEEPLGDRDARAALASDPYEPVKRPWLRRGEPSLADVARRELRHPGLVALLEEHALRYGEHPRYAPASLVALAYLEQSFGTWYVAGGMRALADAVFLRCEQRGVEFRFGAETAAVLRKDGRAAGLELADGSHVEADTVVSGIDVIRLAELLGHGPDGSPGGSPGAGPGESVLPRETISPPGRFTLFLALRGPRPAGTVHRTVVHAPDRAAELDAVFAGGTPCDRPTVEVLRPDDAAVRPDGGHEAVTLRVTVAAHGSGEQEPVVDWTADGLAGRYEERVLDAAEAALPGLRERILWCEARTPADTERETGAPGGGVHGPALAGRDGAYLSVANASPVPGLYLVGGSAHPGGGLPHAGMSGAITAELIGGPAAGERA